MLNGVTNTIVPAIFVLPQADGGSYFTDEQVMPPTISTISYEGTRVVED